MRGRILGRRGSCGRRHRNRSRVLCRRRPTVVGRGSTGPPERVLEVVRGVQERTRPTARDREANDSEYQRHRGRRRQRAADGLRPLGDRRQRLHRHVGIQHGSVPADDATQWLRLIVEIATRARSIPLSDPRRRRQATGASSIASFGRPVDGVVDEWVEKLAAGLPQSTRSPRKG